MKILCVSDQIDPLVYSLNAKERYKDVDFVISAGDLPMEYLDYILSTLNKPVYFVFGNHNLHEFAYYHHVEGRKKSSGINQFYPGCGANYLGFKTAKEGNILLAGLSGSLRYNNGRNQYTEFQMTLRIFKIIPSLIFNKLKYGRYLDILVTHAAPAGINDKDDPCHRGFKCFRWFMHRFKPKYLLHGHIHLYDLQTLRVSEFESTQVINVYSRYIIETDDKNGL